MRQLRAAYRYVRDRDRVVLDELVFLLAQQGHPKLADEVERILKG